MSTAFHMLAALYRMELVGRSLEHRIRNIAHRTSFDSMAGSDLSEKNLVRQFSTTNSIKCSVAASQ